VIHEPADTTAATERIEDGAFFENASVEDDSDDHSVVNLFD